MSNSKSLEAFRIALSKSTYRTAKWSELDIWNDALEFASQYGYVPPAPPKPEIRLFDRVRLGFGEYIVVRLDGDLANLVSVTNDRTELRGFLVRHATLISRPTWTPVEQSDR